MNITNPTVLSSLDNNATNKINWKHYWPWYFGIIFLLTILPIPFGIPLSQIFTYWLPSLLHPDKDLVFYLVSFPPQLAVVIFLCGFIGAKLICYFYLEADKTKTLILFSLLGTVVLLLSHFLGDLIKYNLPIPEDVFFVFRDWFSIGSDFGEYSFLFDFLPIFLILFLLLGIPLRKYITLQSPVRHGFVVIISMVLALAPFLLFNLMVLSEVICFWANICQLGF